MSGSKRLAIALFALAIAVPATLGVFVAPAMAASVTVGLSAVPSAGHYGDELTITPSLVGTSTLTGDLFTLYLWTYPDTDATEKSWVQYGEQLKVEDTGTIDPMYVFVNEEFLPYPAQLMMTFYSKPSSVNETSTPIFINAYKNKKTTLRLSGAHVIRRRHNATIIGAVTPTCGPGNMSVRVYKRGRVVYRATVLTDESGEAEYTQFFSKPGTYTVKMRWSGNAFGPGNGRWVSRTIHVR
jgi:hypothetical protein